MSPRQGECPGATPGSRTNFLGCTFASHLSVFRNPISRAPARAAESPKLSLSGAAPGWLANFHGVVADKVMHLPASNLIWGRYPSTPPFHHGELDYSTERSLINFFRWV